MAALKTFLLFSVISFCLSFENDLATYDTTKCEAKCYEVTFMLDEQNNCKRGCRFYGLDESINKNDENVLVECQNDCKLAYEDFSSHCEKGCDFQEQFSAEDKITVEDPSDEWMPIMQMRKVVSSIADGMLVIRSTLTTYFRDNGQIVAVESAPTEIRAPIPIFKDNIIEESNPVENGLLESEPKWDNFVEKMQERLEGTEELYGPRLEDPPYAVSMVPLRQSNAAKLLLLLAAATMGLGGLAFCIAIVRSRSRHAMRQKEANLSLALATEPLKLVRPEDLTKLSLMEEDGKTQHKQDLAMTHATV